MASGRSSPFWKEISWRLGAPDFLWHARNRSSQSGPHVIQRRRLQKEMLVGAVQRLVPFRRQIPPHTNGKDVRIRGAQKRGKIKLQAFLGVSLELQPPASHRRQGRESKIPLWVFQMFMAAQDFYPFPFV